MKALEYIELSTYPIRRDSDGSILFVAEVDRIKDGDTMDVVRISRDDESGCSLKLISIRLAHIDTPEMRGPSPEEREMAREARDFVLSIVALGDIVFIYDLGPDKYGRRLAQVTTLKGMNIGEELLKEGLAAPYGERPWRK